MTKLQLKDYPELYRQLLGEAIAGYGREREIGGGNTQVDISILPSDSAELGGKTARFTLNKKRKVVGHSIM
jgi:hypothetical protein